MKNKLTLGISNTFIFSVLAVVFFASVLLINTYLKGYNADLSEDQVYSLSPGSEKILSELKEPIKLYYFFSDETSTGMTTIRDYAVRVQSLLEEYERKSNGKITLELIDPEPFSEDEDRAASFGLTAASTGFAQDSVYFGLAGTNSLDDSMIIGFFDPQKESFLEYDISNLVYQLSQPEAVKVTLLTDLQVAGGQNPLTGQSLPPNVLYQQLTEFFDVTLISSSDAELPEQTQVLLILHPQNVNDELLKSIDQFLLNDGKALVFMAPHYESDPMAQMGSVGANSSVFPLLEHYGVQTITNQVVLDAQTGLEVRGNNNQIIRHLGFLGLGQAQINDEDITSADLDTLNGASFGKLQLTDNSGLSQIVLLSSSENSGLMGAPDYAAVSDPNQFGAAFNNDEKSFVLAARYTGSATTYFTQERLKALKEQASVDAPSVSDALVDSDGNPVDSGEETLNELENEIDAPLSDSTEEFVEEEGTLTSETLESKASEQTFEEALITQSDNMNIVVIADADFTADRFWVQRSNFFGQTVFSPFANNGDFVINLVENLGGSEGLIGIRSRGTFARPFTRVQDIRVKAEQKFREQEQRLQQQLEETEAQLAELQGQGDTLTLDAAQQTAIDNFTQQRIDIRKSLREVQFQLDKDIDELGNWLKLINIVFAPVVLVLVLLLFTKALRRKAPK